MQKENRQWNSGDFGKELESEELSYDETWFRKLSGLGRESERAEVRL